MRSVSFGISSIAVQMLIFAAWPAIAVASDEERPNILWLSSEDNGPHLGAYGDALATTPNLDALAKRGMIYTRAWSNAPVCAPARTAIISGLYPPSTGSEHMRSRARLPEGFRFFPQLLREQGYYVTNNAKEDYNLEKPGQVWDESSRQAHWRKRPEGAPFFSVFNFLQSHESQIRKRPHQLIHDPAAVRLPAYHPDTPEVRRDWAQYYDKMTEVDTAIGAVLEQLEQDGLAENTIVFYWGDHGIGLPRGKRTVLNSGLHVPLIVSIPRKFRHLATEDWEIGGSTDRLVGFVDFAPTVLSLAGIEAPREYQGAAFLGHHEAPAKEHLFGFRGRMDERIDLVRAVFDGRYVYSRNFMPHRSHAQHVWYMFQTPTTQVWQSLFESGETTPAQRHYWAARRSPEELYDLRSDPDEVNNLADSEAHLGVRKRLAQSMRSHLLAIRDTGFLSEADLRERTVRRSAWEVGHDDVAYPLVEILDAAELATAGSEGDTAALLGLLDHHDAAVRYWGAQGFLIRGGVDREMPELVLRRLSTALGDSSMPVALTAAEFNVLHGGKSDRTRALDLLVRAADVRNNPAPVVWQALNVLDALDGAAEPVRPALRALPTEVDGTPGWARTYVPRLVEKLLADLE